MIPEALTLTALGALGLVTQGVCRPQSNLFCKTLSRLPPTTSDIALTFDDGPRPGSTELILEALAKHNARATFFVIGRHAAAHPDLLAQIHHAGHLLANHTFDHHRDGLLRAASYWRDQVQRTDDLIAETTGEPPAYFRAPMGLKAPPLARAVRNHTVVAWSRRAYDTRPNAQPRIKALARSAKPRDIILLHDGSDRSHRAGPTPAATALPDLLKSLADRGLRSVRLDHIH